ncbi:electron transfer flavoprotein subunit beta/FixA family protein [Myceligenerans pegani]|uniref:Electron transfer flavoprotein subunit beta n=1 Tax=Myceligenerans pegani TaxID=2776917 RepID=A0ABR9MYC1_9MICO|nr:electron transfer flavoprotein subunit beta/FixA family protein [Myceligenerans sp. TRM 65318]MBE1876006.1 electron transfer flavoprotein subunit beta/FixA family protein [Myceligenerans sp. TRM 65318]MBE3018277.1 electron transfer flavoprotein subunit beta/FixA family protein [Myceligenerans sp. TRM 65318]
MRIVVTVKYVPDINTDRGFEDCRVRRTPDEGTLNELDENAIEAALQLVEAAGEGEVVALTVAPPDGDPALRKAFQLGVDRGVRVSDDILAGADYFATAAALAAAVRKLESEGPVDLVITGMAALDGLGSVVPTLLATELGRPALTLAKKLGVSDGVLSVTREHDDVTEELSAPLPAVLSVTDTANQPRLPNFKRIMAARGKQVEAWTASDLGLDAAPAARTRTLSAGPRPERPEAELVTDKGEGGKALAQYLIKNDLV